MKKATFTHFVVILIALIAQLLITHQQAQAQCPVCQCDQVIRVTAINYGSCLDSGEIGNEEFTVLLGGTCFTADGGTGTRNYNEIVFEGCAQSTTLSFEAWEDDRGSRCNYDCCDTLLNDDEQQIGPTVTPTIPLTSPVTNGTFAVSCVTVTYDVECTVTSSDLLIDLNPAKDDVCDGEAFWLGVSVSQQLRDFVDPDCSGAPFDQDLVLFGWDSTPGSFPSNPYLTTGVVIVDGPATDHGGTTGNQVECDYELLSLVTLPPHGGGCEPEQRVVYSFLDEAVADNLGLANGCHPFVSDVITVWPEPADHNTITVTYEGCIARFEPECPNMVVDPEFVHLDQVGASTSVTIHGGSGNPCAPVTVTVPLENPSFDPTFTLPICICEEAGGATASINLALDNPPLAGDLPTGLTLGDVIVWNENNGSGTAGTSNGVTDNGDGTAIFNVPIQGGDPIPGVYTICADVGLAGCRETHCETITVKETTTAIITDEEVCITELPAYIDLTHMFSSNTLNPTDVGGTFTQYGGSGTGSVDGNHILFIDDIADLPTAHGSGTQSGTFQMSYQINTPGVNDDTTGGDDSVNDNDGCDTQDTGTLTVRFLPNPYWDSPSFICSDEEATNLLDMNNYLEDPNVQGTGTWTSNCAGLITAAGVVDPTAVAEGTICSITFTSDDPPGTTCPMTTHTEYIAIIECTPPPCTASLTGWQSPICTSDDEFIIYDSRGFIDANPYGIPPADGSSPDDVIGTYTVYTDEGLTITTTTGFTDNGDGTLTVDPQTVTNANAGVFFIQYCIDDTPDEDDPCHGYCLYEIIEIYPSIDPTFALAAIACEGDAAIDLTLDAIAEVTAYTGAGNEGDIVEWYAQAGNNVTDNGDGSGSFNPATPGVYTVCVEVGTDICARTYCSTIEVLEQPTIGTPTDFHLECSISSTGSISLSALFPGADEGGTYTYVSGGATGSVVGGALVYTAAGCYEISYEFAVSTCNAVAAGSAFVYVSEQPQPSFDLAEEYCWDGTAGNTLTPIVSSPTYTTAATQAWTSSATGVATVDAATGVVTVVAAGAVDICLQETITNVACNGTGPQDCIEETCHTLSIFDTSTLDPTITATPNPVCAGTDVTITATGNQNGEFTGIGVTDATANDGTAIFNSATPGTYTVTYTVNAGEGCTATMSIGIEVQEQPSIGTPTDVHIECYGAYSGNVSLSSLFPDADLGGTYTYVSGGATGSIVGGAFVYTAPGCYEISYEFTATDADACAAVAAGSAFVYVSERPEPSFDLGEEYCWDGTAGNTITALVNSYDYITAATEVWSTSDVAVATVDATGVVTIVGAGVVEICLEETITNATCNGTGPQDCINETCHTLTVVETAAIDATITATPNPVCAGVDVTITATGNQNGEFTGEGVTDATPNDGTAIFNSTTPGIYTVNYTVNSSEGCTATMSIAIEVQEQPSIGTPTDLHIECSISASGSVSIASLFPGASEGGTYTYVSGGATGSIVGGELVYTAAGCYEISYEFTATDADACVAVAAGSAFVYVSEEPQPSFDLAEEVCWDGTAGNTLTPIINSPEYTTAAAEVWTSSNTAVATVDAATGVVTIVAAGTVDICLEETITNPACNATGPQDCVEESCHTVTIIETGTALDPTFTAVPNPVCQGVDVVLTATGDQNGEFTGEGVTDATPNDGTAIFNSTTPGIYTVTYTVNSGEGCTATMSLSIEVQEQPTIGTPTDLHVECSISASGSVSIASLFPGASEGGTYTYVSGGATGSIVGGELVYTAAGCYEISYEFTATDADACVAVAAGSAFVYVSEEPQPSFDLAEEVCWDGTAGNTLTPIINSPEYTTAAAEVWTSSNTAVATVDAATGVVTIVSAGTVDICLEETITNPVCNATGPQDCVEESCHTLTIVETGTALDPTFTAVPNPVCQGVDVVLTATGDQNGEFTGEGVTDATPNDGTAIFNSTTPGIYTVTYTVNSGEGCTATMSLSIEVQEQPSIGTPTDLHIECSVSASGSVSIISLFPGASEGGTYTYVSGGATGSIVGEELVYTAPGCYEVSYEFTATDADACNPVPPGSAFVYISEQPQPDFDLAEEACWDGTIGNVLVPIINSPIYTTPAAEVWTSTDPTIATVDVATGFVTIVSAGTVGICLEETITNPACNGTGPQDCVEQTCHILTIIETATALDPTFTADPNPVCPGLNVILTATGNQNGEFTGEGVVDPVANDGSAIFNSSTPGTYTITYTINTDEGCTASMSLLIEVLEQVDATINSDYTACFDEDGQFDLTSLFIPGTTTEGGIFTFVPNGTAATVEGDILTYPEPGQYTVNYTIGDPDVGGQCFDFALATITIIDVPAFSFDMPETACIDDGDFPQNISNFLENENLANGEVFINGGSVAVGTDYSIDLLGLGAGDYTITYTEIIPADANNPECTFSWTQYLSILEAGDPSWTPTTPVCVTDAPICLEPDVAPTNPTTPYDWSGTGVIVDPTCPSGFAFDPAQANIGLNAVTYCIGEGACQQCETHLIEVIDQVDATINPATVCEASGGQFDLTALWIDGVTTLGGTFTVNTGTVSGDILTYIADDSFPIEVEVTYTVGIPPFDDANGCGDAVTVTLTIIEQPDAAFDLPTSFCELDPTGNNITYDLNDYLTSTDNLYSTRGGPDRVWTVVSGAATLNPDGTDFDPTGTGEVLVSMTETFSENGVECSHTWQEVVNIDAFPCETCAEAQDINLDNNIICADGSFTADVVPEGNVVLPDDDGDGLGAYGIFISGNPNYNPYINIPAAIDSYITDNINVNNPVIPQVVINNDGTYPTNTIWYMVGTVWDNGPTAVINDASCLDETSFQPFILLDSIDVTSDFCQCTNNGTDGTDSEFLVGITFNGGGAPSAYDIGGQSVADFLTEHNISANYNWQLSGGVSDGAGESSGTAALGETISIRVVDGQPWSVTITDDAGCSHVINGSCNEPEPAFTGLDGIYCTDDPPNPLFDASIFEAAYQGDRIGEWYFDGTPAPNGSLSGSGLVDNGDGTATFDPFWAGPGQHTVTYCIEYGNEPNYQNPNDPNCQNDANSEECKDNCIVCTDQIVTIYPTLDPAFFAPTAMCIDGEDASLTLDDIDNILLLWENLEPTFDPDGTVDEEDFFINWIGYGVNDLNDGNNSGSGGNIGDGTGSATFNPMDAITDYNADAISNGSPVIDINNPADFPLCILVKVEVGYPNCVQELEKQICIDLSVNAAIDDATVCGGDGQFDLTALFTDGITTPGGIFTIGSGGFTSGNGSISGDILSYEQNSDFPIIVEIEYTVGYDPNGGDCVDSNTAILTIIEQPDASFDLPFSLCEKDLEGNVIVYDLNDYLTSTNDTYATDGGPVREWTVLSGPATVASDGSAFTPTGLGSVSVQLSETFSENGVDCVSTWQEIVEIVNCNDCPYIEDVAVSETAGSAICETTDSISVTAYFNNNIALGSQIVFGYAEGNTSVDPYNGGELTEFEGNSSAMVTDLSGTGDGPFVAQLTGAAFAEEDKAVDCDPKTFIIYAYLGDISPFPEPCAPVAVTELSIFPIPEMPTTSTVLAENGNCTTVFIPACPDDVITPSTYIVTPDNVGQMLPIQVSGGAANPCTPEVYQIEIPSCCPESAWDGPSSFCRDGGTIDLTTYITSESEGHFTEWQVIAPLPVSTITDATAFDPSSYLGLITIEYSVSFTEDGSSTGTIICTNTGRQVIEITEGGDATWENPSPVCENSSVINLEDLATNTSGGIWSGDGVADDGDGTYSFDPTAVGEGSYSVTYTVGEQPCEGALTQNILVLDAVTDAEVALEDVTVCIAGVPEVYNLNNLFTPTTVSGGNFSITGGSGSGVISSNILTINEAGTFDITYSLGSAGSENCYNEGTAILTVLLQPAFTLDAPEEWCGVSKTPFNFSEYLYGTAGGGMWTLLEGTGSLGESLDPLTGEYTPVNPLYDPATAALNLVEGYITIQYSENNGVCEQTVEQVIWIDNCEDGLDVETGAAPAGMGFGGPRIGAPICEADQESYLYVFCGAINCGVLDITGMGGVPPYTFDWYSHDGNNDFSPFTPTTVVTTGLHQVAINIPSAYYKVIVTDQTGLTDNTYFAIHCSQPEAALTSEPPSMVCAGSSVELGVNAFDFDPIIPAMNLTCSDDSPIDFDNSEANAIYEWSVSPSDASIDDTGSSNITLSLPETVNQPTTYTITYSVSDEAGCMATGEVVLDVRPEVVAEISEDAVLDYCQDSENIDLTLLLSANATPGGTFYVDGESIFGNSIDPDVAAGTYTVTYQVGDAQSVFGSAVSSCNVSAAAILTIHEGADAEWLSPGTLCLGEAQSFDLNSLLTDNATTGGEWSVAPNPPGVFDGVSTFNPAIGEGYPNVYSVSYTVNLSDGRCVDVESDFISIVDQYNAKLAADEAVVCYGEGESGIDLTDYFITGNMNALDNTSEGGIFEVVAIDGETYNGSPLINGTIFTPPNESANYTIIYYFEDSPDELCGSDSDGIELEVVATPTSLWNGPARVCAESVDLTSYLVSSSTVIGETTWEIIAPITASIDEPTNFDPNVYNGQLTIQYTESNSSSNGTSDCENILTIDIEVYPTRDAYFYNPSPVCSDKSIHLNPLIKESGGGVFSGACVETDNSGNYYFNPLICGAGTYPVTYTVGEGLCRDEFIQYLAVYNQVEAGISEDASTELCNNEENFPLYSLLSPETTVGGDFYLYSQGTLLTIHPSNSNYLNISALPDSLFTDGDAKVRVVYIVGVDENDPTSTNNACNARTSILLTVYQGGNANWLNPGTICAGEAVLDLNNFLAAGADTGGTWSGEMVSSDGLLDLSATGGEAVETVITYSVDNGGCTTSVSDTLRIRGSVIATVVAPTLLCGEDHMIDLNGYLAEGSTEGGSWSGEFVQDRHYVNPWGLWGSYQFVYTVGLGDCSNSDTLTLAIEMVPDASWQSPVNVCESDGMFDLNEYLLTENTNGTWSGEGVNGNLFDPTGLEGTIYVTHSVDDGQCVGNDRQIIHVFKNVDPSWEALGTICSDHGTINLDELITGTTGGYWQGAGVNGNTFDPTGLEGAYLITYVVGETDCSEELSQIINISRTPYAPLASETVYVCDGADIPTLEAIGEFYSTFNWYASADANEPIAHNGLPTFGMASLDISTYVNGAGTYIFYVEETNAGGCTSERTAITVELGSGFSVDYTVSCVDAETGMASLSITPNGGDAPYEISTDWMHFNPLEESVEIAGDRATTFVLRDANGCETAEYTLMPDAAIDFEALVSCVEDDGSVNLTIVPSDDGENYEVSTTGGVSFDEAGVYEFDLNINEVAAVSVQLRSAGGCLSEVKEVMLDEPLFFTVTTTCADPTTGFVSINIQPNTSASYTVNVNGNDLSMNQNSFTVNPSDASNVEVYLRSENGCISDVQNIAIQEAVTADFTLYPTDPAINLGLVIVEPRNGVPPYTLSFDNGMGFGIEGNYQALLAIGTHQLVVRDSRGCLSEPQLIEVLEAMAPPKLAAYSITDIDCIGEKEVVLGVEGASKNEQYHWFLDASATIPANPPSGSSITPIPQPVANTTYYVQIVNAEENARSATLAIEVNVGGESIRIANSISKNCSETEKEYQVSFELAGGSDYQLLEGAGTIDENGLFISDLLASGESYYFVIEDANSCGRITVQGVQHCICTGLNEAGECIVGSGKTDGQLCYGESATAKAVGHHIEEEGMELGFILHDNADGDMANATIYGYSKTGEFINDGTYPMDKILYISSAISSAPFGSNVDGNCDVFTKSTASILMSSELAITTTIICSPNSDTYDLPILVEGGVPPYTIFVNGKEVASGNAGIFGPFIDGAPYEVKVVDSRGCEMTYSETPFSCVKVSVELISFTGEVQQSANLLKWTTASEKDSDYFTLMRSTDGSTFQAIAKVDGAGTTTDAQNYSHTDKDIATGTYYYRLDQTDFDGLTKQSNVISLTRGERNFTLVNVYPIPVLESVNISYTVDTDTEVQVRIYDTYGRLVAEQSVSSKAGTQTATLDASQYSAGVYFVTLTNGTKTLSTKFVKR